MKGYDLPFVKVPSRVLTVRHGFYDQEELGSHHDMEVDSSLPFDLLSKMVFVEAGESPAFDDAYDFDDPLVSIDLILRRPVHELADDFYTFASFYERLAKHGGSVERDRFVTFVKEYSDFVILYDLPLKEHVISSYYTARLYALETIALRTKLLTAENDQEEQAFFRKRIASRYEEIITLDKIVGSNLRQRNILQSGLSLLINVATLYTLPKRYELEGDLFSSLAKLSPYGDRRMLLEESVKAHTKNLQRHYTPREIISLSKYLLSVKQLGQWFGGNILEQEQLLARARTFIKTLKESYPSNNEYLNNVISNLKSRDFFDEGPSPSF